MLLFYLWASVAELRSFYERLDSLSQPELSGIVFDELEMVLNRKSTDRAYGAKFAFECT